MRGHAPRLALVLVALVGGCADEGGGPPSGAAAPAAPPPARGSGGEGDMRFVDVTDDSGIDFVHDAGRTEEKHLPETMGSGAALVDVDEDGDLDLYLVQGGPLVRRESAARPLPTNRLYANRGDGTFEDATAGCGAAAHDGYGMAVATGDADGDGHVDLFVTNLGPDALLRGDGRGRFEEATRPAALADPRWTAGATFLDAEPDGDLDLYVTAYLQVDLEHPFWCGRREPGWRTVCHPDRYPGLQDRFWRNDGTGVFEDATGPAGLADSWGKGLGAIATDLDADGHPELYVANDSVENRLWHNLGDGTFEDATLLSGTGVNLYGATEAGMGLASGDVDGDGDLDLYVTNFDHESHTLYTNDGGLLFTDSTAPFGLEAATRLPVGFGAVLEDLDDDGDLDIAVANGHIVEGIGLYDQAQTWAQPAQLFRNEGPGRFRDVSAGSGDLATPRVGRGLYAGDLDGDGDRDLVSTENGGRARVLVNATRGGRAALLVGLPPGARVRAEREDGRVLVREAGPPPSYFGQGAPDVALGLGPDGRVVRLAIALGPDEVEVPLDAPLGPGRHLVRREDGRWRVDPAGAH